MAARFNPTQFWTTGTPEGETLGASLYGVGARVSFLVYRLSCRWLGTVCRVQCRSLREPVPAWTADITQRGRHQIRPSDPLRPPLSTSIRKIPDGKVNPRATQPEAMNLHPTYFRPVEAAG